MKKFGKRICVLFVLTLCFFLLASCQKEEVYNPVKKTGEEAPPLELPLADPNKVETNSDPGEQKPEVKEETKEAEVPQEKETFHDFNKRHVFKVVEDEILVRSGPSFDHEIIKYFAKDDELEVVDKIVDANGEKWYVVRLTDYGLTHGYTVSSNLKYEKEKKVEEPQSRPETTGGELETSEE